MRAYRKVKRPKRGVAPPGWKKTVEDMKDESDIDNPFALAWWMKGKGHNPHPNKKSTVKGSYSSLFLKETK